MMLAVGTIAAIALTVAQWPRAVGEASATATSGGCNMVNVTTPDPARGGWHGMRPTDGEPGWAARSGRLVVWSNGTATFHSDSGDEIDLTRGTVICCVQ